MEPEANLCSENMKELDSWAVFFSGHLEKMQNASNGKFAEAEEVRKQQGKPHHNAENVTDCWSEEHGVGFSVTAILNSGWSALELMHGVKCTGEWPSAGLFALETHLRVWFSGTVWMDLGLLLLELCCSSPGAFGAVMDSVGWEGTRCSAALEGPPTWSTWPPPLYYSLCQE